MAMLQLLSSFYFYAELFLNQNPDAGKMRTTHIRGTFPGVDEDEIIRIFFSYNSSETARGLLY